MNHVISDYVKRRLDFKGLKHDKSKIEATKSRVIRAFENLPLEILNLFLDGSRNLSIKIIPDPKLPFGMRTITERSSKELVYTLNICDEAQGWAEDHFLGAVLRQLGHITAELPPDDEWPKERGARARFKESIECKADALVWSWGLRHYDMIYLSETYPSHWVDKIVNDISMMMLTMGKDQ
ncbi:MAG: hypothetical protein ACP5VS_19040 [Desulfomonilaceae bacterium]